MTAAGPWDAAPCGLLLLGADGTVREANATFLTWLGRARDEVVGRLRLPELLSVGGRIYWETHLSPLLLVDGQLDEVALELVVPAGRLPVLLSARTGPDDLVRVALTSARERVRYERELLGARRDADLAARRLTALQSVTARLSRAVGPAGVGEALLDAAVGGLGAAAATLWLTSPDGPTAAGSRGEDAEEGRLPAGAAQCLGRAAGQVDGRVIVPLPGSRALRGLLHLRPRADAGSDPVDLELLTAVGQQGGLALDRALLHEQSATVAHELQHALLAVETPVDARFAVATTYRAGLEVLEVGGDWYDVFLAEQDVLSVGVGDVVGRGLAAASAMGQLRSAVRALAGPGTSPAELLSRLDRFAEQREGTSLATLAHAQLDLTSGRVRYACAGHPPPVLLPRNGVPRLLWDGRSTPLGSFVAPAERSDAEVQLAAGDRLLLYTDGLVERRDTALDEQLTALETAAAALVDLPLDDAVRTLTTRLLADEESRDDVCVLLLEWSGPVFERQLPADPRSVAQVRRQLGLWLAERGVDGPAQDDVVLATSEAVANAAEHGSGWRPTERVQLRVRVASDGAAQSVLVSVRDSGRWRAPTASVERGRGMHIIQALVDDVVVDTADGTLVRLRKRLEEAS